MAVYVDELIDYGVTYGRAGPEWSHLTADTIHELHAFAERLGLRRRWFQGPPKHVIPHYDLTRGMRAKAVRLGAIEVESDQHISVMLAKWRNNKQE